MTDISVCPCTLAPGYNTYSPVAVRHFLGGKKASHILPYAHFPSESDIGTFNENRKRMSLSGAQSKYSVLIDDGRFRLAGEGERGTYILKPAISDFENRGCSPANEHLTMQIAYQVYGIETAECGLCFSEEGDIAYLVKRYDIAPDGSRIQQEDFASLGGITAETHGRNYKYDALSYEDLGLLMKKYLPAWPVETVKFFDLILFNFLFANGDAHAKNFSALRTPDGDYRLAPAYDLVNTQIHIPDDSIFALRKGLYPIKGDWLNHYVCGTDFLELASRIGIPPAVAKKELERFRADYSQIDVLIERSFLPEEIRKKYKDIYSTRLNSFLRAK